MARSKNSRKGIQSQSNKRWKDEYHGAGRTKTRSVFAKQKNCGLSGSEDLPHRHEYSDAWDRRSKW